MRSSTSTALVPVAPPTATATSQGCGGSGKGMTARSKWLLLSAAVLALAGVATGTAIFGFAAVLPLLYTLPCLIMVAICMFGMNKGGAANS